ncbi:unnamed protein product [Phytophthora fragariaefolia]|uniref:Unnamed protein product n=1 Tax=Phytophthora fragariaefolia TaxID=1490495 RepID=A0A9W6TR34_9STRA|nr:unnamed protein product [Phytophthora fragariaefolia]
MEQYQQRTHQLGDDGKYHIRVTKTNLLHNHPLENATPVPAAGASAAASTASVAATAGDQSLAAKRRRVERPGVLPPPDEQPEGALGTAARRSAETQRRVPTMADVRRFLERVEIARINQPGAGQSVEERLAAYVNEFATQDGNAAKIFVDEQKVLSTVTLQTKRMRKVFAAFPEVLRVDSMPLKTKESSESSYRIFSLMAHDILGRWQYVQHAIVENDRAETLRVALNQFKAHNARHPRVRALIVPNEDSTQLKELCASFPTARVLYSQFHVLRALHKLIADRSDLSSWHRDRLTGIAQLLVYAPTPLVYGSNIAVMADVLGSKQHSFFRYFIEKWDVFRDRWSTFAREGVTTFSISDSDGPFAPTWNAIFAAVNDEMALDETVAAIRNVIPMEHIEPRWVLAKARHYFDSSEVGESAGDSGLNEHDHTSAPPIGSWQKFVTAQVVGRRISHRMMEMEPEEFDRALRFYKLVETTMNVRPFDLNASVAARLGSRNGGGVYAAAHRPNWVEPNSAITLSQRPGPPALAGTMHVPPSDRVAVPVAARDMQHSQPAQRSQRASATAAAEVIDLQDESEEEEKENGQQTTKSDRAKRSRWHNSKNARWQATRSAEENNSEPSQPASAGKSAENQVVDKPAAPISEGEGSVSSPRGKNSPRAREPWEALDDAEQPDASGEL